jgi:hypothetical protein
MALFKSKGGNIEPAPESPRKELASAIEAQRAAEATVHDLEIAETASVERKMESQHRLEAIQKRHALEHVGGADAFIASMRGGADIGVAELEAPARGRVNEIESAQREIDAISSVRKEIEARIEPGRQAVAAAKGKVKDAARSVLAAAINVDELLAEARTAAHFILGQRALFLYLMSVLPDGPEHDALASFMGQRWLLPEINETWKNNPAIVPFSDALSALQLNADAEVSL